MGEFFKGWRRKIGLASLAMACVLMTAWMRSARGDAVGFVLNDRQHFLVSLHGQFHWFAHKLEEGQTEGETGWSSEVTATEFEEFVSDYGGDPELASEYWVLPFWQFAQVLMLFSAWLIFVKPRKAKAATGSTP